MDREFRMAKLRSDAHRPSVGRRRSQAHERLIVLDHRERVVEVVQQSPPLLVLSRAAEAFGVVLQPIPLDQEKLPRRGFDTPFESKRAEPGHRGDDRLRLSERILEALLFTADDIESGMFEDHDNILTAHVDDPAVWDG